MKFKYVVVLTELGNEAPIMFPETLSHTDVCFKNGDKWQFEFRDVVSAGFVSLYTANDDNDSIMASCSGRSITLNLDSRPVQDSKLFNYFLNSY